MNKKHKNSEKPNLNKKSKIPKKINKNDKKEKSPEINQPEITTFYEFYEVQQPPLLIQCPYYMESSFPPINNFYNHNNYSNHYVTNEFCNCEFCRNNNMVNEPIIEEPDSDYEHLPDNNLPKSISTPDIRQKIKKK